MSNYPIAKNKLFNLNLHILLLGYLEEKLSFFIRIIENKDKNKEEQNNKL